MKNEKLTFTCGEGGEAEEFFVVEQTRLNGVTYLLVADSEEDEELNAVLKVFEELLEDVEIEV